MGASATRAGIASDLRAEADAALYEAKRRGGNQAAHFDDLRERVEVIGSDKRAAVRRILERQAVTTVYQPIKGIADGQLLGYEALSRFEEETGVSGPAEAFDIAEQIARVHELDVLCAAHALTRAPALPDGALLFLNICPRTLDLDADGNDWLVHATREAGLDPARVVVELTERFGGRSASIARCLRRLHDQGFKLAIDDVGTGNSGLALLREVDVDFIKIDRTIVSAAPTDSGARAVLMAIAAYAHQTQASVIAEGIEDDETLEFLQRIDEPTLLREAVIRGGQGYRLGRPAAMPEAADRTSLERAA
jgi:EAL domain-containing protein (putative c-di-GMP-specific phosphodiesterase class I)